MRVLIQRVKRAEVRVEQKKLGAIGPGLLILLGFSADDQEEDLTKIWQKVKGLRIFSDAEGKTNCDLLEVGGNVLLVSQFTLYADLRKGRRPSFVNAAPPDLALDLYHKFVNLARQDFPNLGTGEFGAKMEVELINDGPFTLWLDSEDLKQARRGHH